MNAKIEKARQAYVDALAEYERCARTDAAYATTQAARKVAETRAAYDLAMSETHE